MTENWVLKLFALGLAMILWVYVASERRGEGTEFQFSTPLILKNIPDNMEVVSSEVHNVQVWVRTARSLGSSINPNLFQVSVDLDNQLAGPFTHTLTEKNISYNNNSTLPTGLSILQISPASLPITLEEAVEREVVIRPRFSGDPAEGFTLQRIQIEPDKVRLLGARTQMDTLKFIYTRPLDVQDLNSDVEMLVTLDLGTRLRLAPNQTDFIQARIEVTQSVSRLLLRNIPVQVENATNAYRMSTQRVNVYLEGPEALMQDLNKDNLSAVFDLSKFPPGDYRGQTPIMALPDTVRVLEQWPIIDLLVLNRPLKKKR